MEKLQAFQTAARASGFVEVNEFSEGAVLWLRKNTPDTTRETHQRMCIDRLTNSVTVYWMSVPGKLNAKTFRGVSALQEWFELRRKQSSRAEEGTDASCAARKVKPLF